MITVLGLDVALRNVGIAIVQRMKDPPSMIPDDVQLLRSETFSTAMNEDIHVSLRKISYRLSQFLTECNIDRVVMEDIDLTWARQNRRALQMYSAAWGLVYGIVEKSRPLIMVPVGRWANVPRKRTAINRARLILTRAGRDPEVKDHEAEAIVWAATWPLKNIY